MELAPHDILVLHNPNDLFCLTSQPEWAINALAQTPLVVIRRAPRLGYLIPVGVRGTTRNERFSAYLPLNASKKSIKPEDLVKTHAWKEKRYMTHKSFRVLDEIEAFFAEFDLTWGPVGSVGFELASGYPSVTASSDLDLIIRAFQPLPTILLRTLFSVLKTFPVRIDVLVEMAHGAFALTEYAQCQQEKQSILLRSINGPRIVKDVWDNSHSLEGI